MQRYNENKYWTDRLTGYRFDLRSVGNVSVSQEENQKMYAEARKVFLRLSIREGLDLSKVKMFDIGYGPGFYAKVFLKMLGGDT